MKNSGGFNGIRTHDICEAGATLNQLKYEASQLGAGHVLHTASSWGLSIPFLPGMSYAMLVGLDSAQRLAQLVEHRTTVREVAGSKPRPDQHKGSLNN